MLQGQGQGSELWRLSQNQASLKAWTWAPRTRTATDRERPVAGPAQPGGPQARWEGGMRFWARCTGGAASGGSGLETGGLQRKQKPVRAVVSLGWGEGRGKP